VLQALSLPRAFTPEKFALDKAKERLGLEPRCDRSSKGFKTGLSVEQQRAADERAAAAHAAELAGAVPPRVTCFTSTKVQIPTSAHAAELAGAALTLLTLLVEKYKYRQRRSLQPGKLNCATSWLTLLTFLVQKYKY
jgi:hypothetical protein